MRLLTEQEIKFLKDTHITPTVIQCDEWKRTIFADEMPETNSEYKKHQAGNKIFSHACTKAREQYKVDLIDLYEKIMRDQDFISLQGEAPYILYCFLTKEELEQKTCDEVLEWLRDWKYYFGFRKWNSLDAAIVCQEALDLYNGVREIATFDDGCIYIQEKEDK